MYDGVCMKKSITGLLEGYVCQPVHKSLTFKLVANGSSAGVPAWATADCRRILSTGGVKHIPPPVQMSPPQEVLNWCALRCDYTMVNQVWKRITLLRLKCKEGWRRSSIKMGCYCRAALRCHRR